MSGFQSTAGFRRTIVMVRVSLKECFFMKANFSHQSTDSVDRPTCYFGHEMASFF